MKKKQAILEINYNGDIDFTELARKIERENQRNIKRVFADDIYLIRDILDLLYRIMCYYAWLANNPHIASVGKAIKLRFSACHKNQLALYTSLKLTTEGLYGPARAIMRHVYEAQMLAKFCSVTHDTMVYERWENGDSINFSKSILKRISKPNTDALKEYWGMLCEYSHATVYAQQVALNARSMPDEIPINFLFLKMLLNCQYHLLASHFITPSMHYYAKRYANAEEVQALKENARSLLKSSRKGMLARPREVIRDYRSAWEVV